VGERSGGVWSECPGVETAGSHVDQRAVSLGAGWRT
jgi:hypothetical protein